MASRELTERFINTCSIMLASASMMAGSVLKFNCKRDVLAQQPPEHFGHVADDPVQIERTRIDNLLAAEREQLAREAGGAFGSLFDLAGRGVAPGIQRREGEQRGVARE